MGVKRATLHLLPHPIGLPVGVAVGYIRYKDKSRLHNHTTMDAVDEFDVGQDVGVASDLGSPGPDTAELGTDIGVGGGLVGMDSDVPVPPPAGNRMVFWILMAVFGMWALFGTLWCVFQVHRKRLRMCGCDISNSRSASASAHLFRFVFVWFRVFFRV